MTTLSWLRSIPWKRFGWLAFSGFLLHGNWEWLQTPFYDDGDAAINTVVWYRFHCTAGDVLILVASAVLVSIIVRDAQWLRRPAARPAIYLSLLGIAYTAVSEQIHVGARTTWAYTELMPVLPGTSIGVVPLLQWAVVPPLALWMATRLGKTRF